MHQLFVWGVYGMTGWFETHITKKTCRFDYDLTALRLPSC